LQHASCPGAVSSAVSIGAPQPWQEARPEGFRAKARRFSLRWRHLSAPSGRADGGVGATAGAARRARAAAAGAAGAGTMAGAAGAGTQE